MRDTKTNANIDWFWRKKTVYVVVVAQAALCQQLSRNFYGVEQKQHLCNQNGGARALVALIEHSSEQSVPIVFNLAGQLVTVC